MSDVLSCPHHGVCRTAAAEALPLPVSAGLAPLRVLAITHRTVGLDGLQALSLECDRALRLHHDLAALGLATVVLTTCNRLELYWHARHDDDSAVVLRHFTAAVGARALAPAVTGAVLSGEAAARHLFRVCAGLESLVLGEAEILGQVRAALESCPHAGPFLTGVIQAALRTGRMARAETAIGVGALSVASAAVQWLGRTLRLSDARVVVVGAGDTGKKAARHLRALGTRRLVVVNRTEAHATALAALVGGEATGLAALDDELVHADAVICAVGASTPVLRAEALRRAAARRDGRPLVVIDLSVPAAVEPCVVPGVTCVDLSHLDAQVAHERRRRASEVPRAEAVVTRELGHLQQWAHRHALRPMVADLRRRVEAMRREELLRAQQELLSAGAASADVLDRLSRRLLDQALALSLAPAVEARS